MKRLAALFLMLCLLPFSMLSGAEEAALRYEYDGFEAVLPERCDGELYEVLRRGTKSR